MSLVTARSILVPFSEIVLLPKLLVLILVSTSNIYITLFCQMASPIIISISLAAHPGSQVTDLVYDFVACKALSAAEHGETTMREREREVSNHKNKECIFNCAHHQLHCRPSQGPSTPASRPLRQVTVAGPRVCGSQTQDNADTGYSKRDATRMYSSVCQYCSLASL